MYSGYIFFILNILIIEGFVFMMVNTSETIAFAQDFTGNISGDWSDSITTGTMNATVLTEQQIQNCAEQVSDKFFVTWDGTVIDKQLYIVDFCSNILYSGSIVPNATIGFDYTQNYGKYDYENNGNSTISGDKEIFEIPGPVSTLTVERAVKSESDSDSTLSNTGANKNNWLGICQSIEWGLMNTCNVYVNPDGRLTTEGERAKGCITNGGLLSGGGVLTGLPASTIIGILEPLSERTGCGGIVNWITLKSATNPMDFLNLLK